MTTQRTKPYRDELQDRLWNLILETAAEASEMHDLDDLDIIGVADELCIRLDDLRLRAVVLSRISGATWADIGEVLGITKQSAYARFSDARADHITSHKGWQEETLPFE